MKKIDELQTNAPKQETIGPTSGLNPKHPYVSDKLYPGDSVDQHKKLENANHILNEGELKQQNENL
jgi:hypothetical protein